MLRPVLRGAALGAALVLSGAGLPASAQDVGGLVGAERPTAILLIDSEAAFARSDLGQRIAREIEAASRQLAAENRRIESELIEEEKVLTGKRGTLPPDEFRALADAFDEKVRRIRQEQDAKARALGQQGDVGRREFLTAARPVLEAIMREAGAAVILESRDVFLGAEGANITDEVIVRLNETAGDGTGPATPAAPETPAGETPAPEAGTAPGDETPAQE